MTSEPSAFIQAHRMVKTASWAPFKHWRVAIVVLLICYLPIAVLWGGFEIAMSFATSAFFEAPNTYNEDGSVSFLGRFGLWLIESPFGFVGILFVLSYPLLAWAAIIWWRSQEGAVRVLTSWKSLFWVGVIYLIPAMVSMISAYPLLVTDFSAEDALPDPMPNSEILLNVTTFLTYWLTFRLAVAFVNAAQDQSTGILAGWRATSPDNRLCAFIALDLTVLSLLLDALSRLFQSVSEAKWDRAIENHDVDYTVLSTFDTLSISVETVAIIWLIFVELALIWSIAQRSIRHDNSGISTEREPSL